LLQVIETAIGLHIILAENKSLTLKTNIAPNLQTFYIGDGLRITQILNNLIGNALKFTDKGHITLSVNIQENDGRELICFEVHDTGIGISKQSVLKLFESFNQGDNSAIRNYGGTGLGLTISQTLAQLMHGDIKVESELGVGSKFTMCLPLELANLLDIQTMPKQASQGNLLEQSLISNHQQKNSLENSFIGCTALLVEDNETNRIVAQELLAILGITTRDAHNGEQAIRTFEQEKFDVVLMDLHMPIIDGYSAVKTMRKIETGTPTPIIAMSAAVMSDVADKVKAAGMDGHIPKPIGIYELFIELEKWIKPKEPKFVKNLHNLDKLHTSRADEILMMLSDLPDFDIVNALARMADNVDVYKKLLLSFYHEHQQSADLFVQALNASNNVELQRLAHTLKGAAGTIGATTLQRIALDIEIQVEQGKPPSIEALCLELDNALTTLTPIVNKLKTKAEASLAPKHNITQEQRTSCIVKLIEELNKGQFLSETELKSQHKELVDCISTQDFDALVLHIEHLEYAKAIDLLNVNLK
jgi:CheY-like chemotaxis protein